LSSKDILPPVLKLPIGECSVSGPGRITSRKIVPNIFIILYCDQQIHNYFTNYHTATCFDTIVSSSGRLYPILCQVTQVFQMQLLVLLGSYQQLDLKYRCNLARYWLQATCWWHDSDETCRSV